MKMRAHDCIRTSWSSFMKFIGRLFTCQPMDVIQQIIETKHELRRCLRLPHLFAINIGYIIGTGILVLGGQAAANNAGPAVILSFVIAGISAGLCAMSYSEMASMMPISGSSYSYTAASMGEYSAWIIGWNLILQSFVAAAAAASSWSSYIIHFVNIVSDHNASIWVTRAPIAWNKTIASFYVTGGLVNLPALALIIGLTLVLLTGIIVSTRIMIVIVIIKILTILLFIFACCPYIKREHLTPFIPPNDGSFERFGMSGVLYGVTVVFFAFAGFDAITRVAQETKKPQGSLPKGIIGSFIISNILYLGVSIVMVGIASYKTIGTSIPLIDAIHNGAGLSMISKNTPYGLWLEIIMTLGAVGSLPGVTLVGLLGTSRIFYSMAHDGLVPRIFAKVHPGTKTPWISTIIIGIVCACFAAIFSLDFLRELVALDELLSYCIVHIDVMIMRFTYKDVPRGFRVPFGPWIIPPIGAAICVALMVLMVTQSPANGYRFGTWIGIGQIIYFSYGFWHSKQRSSIRIFTIAVPMRTPRETPETLSSNSSTNESI